MLSAEWRRNLAEEADIGHNSAAGDQIKAYVERLERLEEEKASYTSDIKEVYSEAKSNGFDVKTLRKLVRIRKMDAAKRQEEEAMLDLYLHACGMI